MTDTPRALPSLLERAGVHRMRPVARAWCRSHQAEALELGSWSADVVRDLFGEATADAWSEEIASPRKHIARGAMED